MLCIRTGFNIPGTKTIPEQISEDKCRYYACLDKADAAYKTGKVDVSAMEELISELLAAQLLSIDDKATQ